MKVLGLTVSPGQRFHNRLLLKRYMQLCAFLNSLNSLLYPARYHELFYGKVQIVSHINRCRAFQTLACISLNNLNDELIKVWPYSKGFTIFFSQINLDIFLIYLIFQQTVADEHRDPSFSYSGTDGVESMSRQHVEVLRSLVSPLHFT